MKRTLFSLVLMLGLVLPAATEAMAQPTSADQTFVSEVTADEVDLGTSGNITFIEENYDLRESLSFQEEYIWFTYGWSNFQLVLIAGPNESEDYHDITLGNMEVFYDSWTLIDEEVTDEHSWFLGEGEVDGAPLIVYYEFELDAFGETDLVVMQFTDISTFQHDLETVQGEVTIGGNPLLPQTDAAELVELAGGETGATDASPDAGEGNESETDRSRTTRGGTDDTVGADEEDSDTGVTRTSRGGTDDTDDADEEDSDSGVSRTSRGGVDDVDDVDEEDESDSDRSRTSRGGSANVGDDEEESTSRTSRTSRTDTDDSNDSETGNNSRVGRLGDTLTTGSEDDDAGDSTPVSGGDWDAMGLISDTEWQSPTYGNVVTWDGATWEFPPDFDRAIVVNDDPPFDTITLQTTDGLGYVYLTVDQVYESTPASLVDYWVSDDYDALITNGVTVLETGTTSTSATLVYETTNAIDQPLVVVLEATFLDDDTVVFTQISAAPDMIHDVYGQFVDGVEIDGVPFEMTFTVEDIRDISGN